MKILRVFGLGLLIIVLKVLVPDVLAAGERTFVVGFNTMTSVLNLAQASFGAFHL